MIKKILPFEKFVYHSTLDQEALMLHLRKEINGIEYFGKIYESKFEITRRISYRNSFLPIIKGEVTDRINGSTINVKMGLRLEVKYLMIIIFSGLLFFFFLPLFLNESESNPMSYMPLIVLGVGVFFALAGFKFETKQSIHDLERILKAQIVEK